MLLAAGIILFLAGLPLALRSRRRNLRLNRRPPARKKSDKKQKRTPPRKMLRTACVGPFACEKDLEVGQYYMRKGDGGRGIDRFQDATTAKPAMQFPSLFR